MPKNAVMNRYVALLRGINVGGKNKLPMKDLAALFEAAGASSVETFIQSGNVVFAAGAKVAERIPVLVTESITRQFALKVPVVLRSSEELRAAVEGNPFLDGRIDLATLHVAFLSGTPDPKRVESLDRDRSKGDSFEVRGREIYLHLPGGMGRTKLTNDYFDRALSLTSTVRNWNTTRTLLEMATRS